MLRMFGEQTTTPYEHTITLSTKQNTQQERKLLKFQHSTLNLAYEGAH